MLAALTVICAPAHAQGQPAGGSQEVLQQMQAISGEKAQRTPAQQKLDSGLLYASRIANGQPQFPNAPGLQLPNLATTNQVGSDGRVLVDISTTDANSLAAQIPSFGGSVVSSHPAYNTVRASVPVGNLENLAAAPLVKNIRPADEPTTNRITPPDSSPRTEAIRQQLAKGLSGLQGNVGYGATKSEAIVTHGADVAQNAGITGTGVKVCVISDGVDTLAARQAAGELPAVQVLSGQAGSGDEGTAMLELVADMAPGASLGFSTGNGGPAQMATNIQNLRNTMGCDIIVDDLTYFAEAAFQEDIIANAVTAVVNSGAMYFSSAANSGHLTGNNSGTWEGDFVQSGAAVPSPLAGATLQSFGANNYDTLTSRGSRVTLKWSDPIGASSNDYDLYILNSTGTTILGASSSSQTGTQDPYESIACTSTVCPIGARIYVLKFSGSARALRVDTHRGRLSVGTNGSTFGHNAGLNTISVAAISNNFQPISGRLFNSGDTTTTYSSDGPRRLILNPVPATTPITSGCFSMSCGVLLQKVDISAADCDTTTTPGFIPFCGTSAAAPQAAAIAALYKSASPGASNASILARMKQGAIDIMAPGVDVDSGSGIVMANTITSGASTKVTHDFDGDAKSDILWRRSDGNLAIWLMNGLAPKATSALGVIDTSWQIAGSGDFDGDGKVDALWRRSDGNLAIWLMNGFSVVNTATFGTIDTSWQVVGTGDFDGDGKADIVWRHSDGNLAVWLMNGLSIKATKSLGAVDTSWQVSGVGDVDGDSNADLIWRRSDGNFAIWLMSGLSIKGATTFGAVDGSWQVANTGDFDGDGKADVLWRRSDGNVAVWLMNGASIKSSATFGVTDQSWQISGTGDFNGDGKGDILWRNNSGTVGIWLMNGLNVGAAQGVATVTTDWAIQK